MMSMTELRKTGRLAACALAFASSFSMIAVDLAEAGRLGGKGGGSHARYSKSGGGARTYRSAPRAPSVNRDRGGFSGGRLNQRDRSGTLNQRQGRTADRQQVRRDPGSGRQELRGERGARSQDGRTDRTDTRQSNRTERSGDRQENRTDRVGERSKTRREIADDIADNNYWAGHHYGHHHDYWGNDAAWAFFGGLALGAFIASLPPRYETVVVTGTPYYYANGTYYVQSGSQYQVVAPPTGVTVENAPTQVTNVYVNGEEYGYSNGAYYEAKPPVDDESDPTFEVVAPPVGATVTDLPEGTEKKTVNGTDYFVYGETWYQPFYSGSTAVYVVVEKPTMQPEIEGAYVRGIQKQLRALGYDAGPVDGHVGPRTRAVIRRYQRDAGLPVDGIVNEQLLDHLKFALPKTFAFGQPVMGVVLDVQRELAQRDYYLGPQDGLSGPMTLRAVQEFLTDAGLPSTRSIDSYLLEQIRQAPEEIRRR